MAKKDENFKTPFKVTIWTSSHGLASHFFPQALKKKFDEQPRTKISMPTINARGGRIICENFVTEYLEDFEKIKDSKEPRITILLMGDNNLRKYALKVCFWNYKFSLEILEAHRGTCHPLLILGLMPSPRTHDVTIPLAEYMDDFFQETVLDLYERFKQESRFFAFTNSSSFFSDKKGNLLHLKYFTNDGVHLNQKGAEKLAKRILQNAELMVDSVLYRINNSVLKPLDK
jgi:lysophospholipase L1-like esterase